MKKHSAGQIGWQLLLTSLLLTLIMPCTIMAGPSEKGFDPPSGRGPVVVLLSGASGLERYLSFAADIAMLGYYAVLFDGNTYALDGDGNLRAAIEEVLRSPKALPGKVAVIGFSKGGGGALAHAAKMPDLVSAVVAYYPKTNNIPDMASFADQFKVPILVLTGEKDDFFGCCMFESMKAMETAAKERGKSFALVAYSNANHMFNVKMIESYYRAEDSANAWQRTVKMLGQYHTLR